MFIGCAPVDNAFYEDDNDGFRGPNKPKIGECNAKTNLQIPLSKSQNEFKFDVYKDKNNVPHIRANSLEEISFASGYVFSEYNYCTLQKQMLLMTGESAKHFGAHKFSESNDAQDGDMFYLVNDLFVKNFQFLRKAKYIFPKLSRSTQISFNSYASGINSFKKQNNIECNYERQLAGYDIYAYYLYKNSLINLKDIFIEMVQSKLSSQAVSLWKQSLKTDANAFSFGEKQTDKKISSSLFASTYALYDTDFKQFEMQLLIPNSLNVYGVSEFGFPFPQMGFNDNVAWSHTPNKNVVNHLLYELETRGNFYIYNNQPYTIDSTLIEVDFKAYGGGQNKWSVVVPLTHLGWAYKKDDKIYAFKENLTTNTDMIDHWLSLALAKNINNIIKSHEFLRGIPDQFTVAIDQYGRNLKIDSSRAFKLSSSTQAELRRDSSKFNVLKANDNNLPQVNICAQSVTDFTEIPVKRSKNTLWSIGRSFTPKNQNKHSSTYGYHNSGESQKLYATKSILKSNHGGWDSDKAYQALFLDNKSYSFLRERNKFHKACEKLQRAKKLTQKDCQQLTQWSGELNGDKLLEVVIREVFNQKLNYKVAYNPSTPFTTPRNIIVDQSFKQALLGAFRVANGYEFAAPLKQQAQGFSISGGESKLGVMNEAYYSSTAFTNLALKDLQTDSGLAKTSENKMYYPVNYGPSWIMAVDFSRNKPIAKGLLVYGNKFDELDQKQMRLYQNKKLRPLNRFSNVQFSAKKFKKYIIKSP